MLLLHRSLSPHRASAGTRARFTVRLRVLPSERSRRTRCSSTCPPRAPAAPDWPPPPGQSHWRARGLTESRLAGAVQATSAAGAGFGTESPPGRARMLKRTRNGPTADMALSAAPRNAVPGEAPPRHRRPARAVTADAGLSSRRRGGVMRCPTQWNEPRAQARRGRCHRPVHLPPPGPHRSSERGTASPPPPPFPNLTAQRGVPTAVRPRHLHARSRAN